MPEETSHGFGEDKQRAKGEKGKSTASKKEGKKSREKQNIEKKRKEASRTTAQRGAELLRKLGLFQNQDLQKEVQRAAHGSGREFDEERLKKLLESGPLNFIRPAMWGEPQLQPINAQQDNVRNLSFRELIDERWSALGQPMIGRQSDVQAEIDSRINSGDPLWIFSAERDLRELTNAIGRDPILLAEFDQVLPVARRQQLLGTKNLLDQHYTGLFDQLPITTQTARVGDIRSIGVIELGALASSWHQPNEAIVNLLHKARGEADIKGSEGLRLWYAYREIENVIATSEVLQRNKVQPDAEDNIRSAEEIMRFFEKSTTAEAFGLARESLSQLLQAVERSSIANSEKERLRKRIQSFQAVAPFWITYNHEEGNPEAVMGAAKAIEDESFGFYLNRFEDVRDPDGYQYLVDVNGNSLHLNLEAEVLKAFKYQLMVDRYRVNCVEELTKHDLNINTNDADEVWIIKNILGLAQNQPLPALTANQINTLAMAWRDNGSKKAAIKDWYKKQTYLGVDGYAEGSMDLLRDVREGEIMQGVLRQRLLTAGVAPNRIDDLLGNAQNPEGDFSLVEAVKKNAANFVRYDLVSTLDRFRIYNQKGELVDSAYNEDNPFVAHEADHMPDYFISEGHGDRRVVNLIREIADREWKTFFLASNMITFRILNNMKDQWTPNMRAQIDAATATEIANVGPLEDIDRKVEVEAYVMMDLLYKGWNPNQPQASQLDIFNIDWAEGAKTIDNYVIADNLSDRTGGVKMMRGRLKEFTFRPYDAENFFELMKEYYSTRHTRKRPGAEFFLKVFWEAGHHRKEWFTDRENIENAEMERLIDRVVGANIIDIERAEKLKRELLGGPFVREAKQSGTFAFASAKEFVKPGYLWSSFWDYLRSLFTYLTK